MTTPDPRNDDFTEDVRAALGARMRHMDVSEGDLDGVVSRARRGQTVMRIAAAAAVVVVLAGGGALAMQLARGQVDPPDVVAPTLTQTPVPTPGSTGAGATPAPSTPAATATATPTPAPSTPPATAPPTPTSDPSPNPEPTSEPTRSPAEELLATAGTIVTATDDGIDLVAADGTVVDVPGLDGPVDLAFPDGSGGIIFQRNDVGIGLLRNGQVTTLVALSEFQPREFDIGPDETRTIDATGLVLHDVDEVAGRMVFAVQHVDGSQYDLAVVHQADLAGGQRRQVTGHPLWESGGEYALAGDTRLEATWSEAAGEMFAQPVGSPSDVAGNLPGQSTWGLGTDTWFRGFQLRDDAAALAHGVVTPDRSHLVRVRRVWQDEVLLERAVPADFVPVDLTDEVVMVSDGSETILLDVANGSERGRIAGRATIVRRNVSDDGSTAGT